MTDSDWLRVRRFHLEEQAEAKARLLCRRGIVKRIRESQANGHHPHRPPLAPKSTEEYIAEVLAGEEVA